MADPDDEAMFDDRFARYAPGLAMVPENEGHQPFLADLFIACSPLRGVLPDPVVQHQAAIRETAYRADHPHAMRRVVAGPAGPIGRIMIDWRAPGGAALIDIAVLPDHQRVGAGSAMLRALLDVVDARGSAAMLQVAPDNPARRLYERLGFVAVETEDFTPYVDMLRASRAAG